MNSSKNEEICILESFSVEDLSASEADAFCRLLATAVPAGAIKAKRTEYAAGRFAVSVAAPQSAVTACAETLIQAILEAHCNEGYREESIKNEIQALVEEGNWQAESWIISRDGVFLKLYRGELYMGHTELDAGKVVLCIDSSVSTDDRPAVRSMLDECTAGMMNPVTAECEAQAIVLMRNYMRSPVENGRHETDTDTDSYRIFERSAAQRISTIIKSNFTDYEDPSYMAKRMSDYLKLVSSLLDDARLNQVLQRCAVEDSDFDISYIMPMAVPAGFTAHDVKRLIRLATICHVDLERYHYAIQRLCFMKTFTVCYPGIVGHISNPEHDHATRNCEELEALLTRYPDKDTFIRRRLAELTMRSYGSEKRKSHKPRCLMDEESYVGRIGREIEKEATAAATAVADEIEPLQLKPTELLMHEADEEENMAY